MTGTEKILRHIAGQAEEEAKAILEEARTRAGEITARSEKESAAILAEGKARAEAVLKDAADKAEAAASMQKRRTVLAQKGELVSDVLQSAYRKLLTLPDAEYFDFLYAQLAKQDLKGEGVLYLNEKDLARRPAGFNARVQAAAAEKGGKLTVSETARPMDGGFLLDYGGIEENCSFQAIFESEADALKDAVRAVLF